MEGEDEGGVNSKRVEALKEETRFEWFCKLQGGVHSGNTDL